MNGRHYNHGMRCHKLMAEALHRLNWQTFLESLSEGEATHYTDFIRKLQNTFPSQVYRDIIDGKKIEEMIDAYQQCVKTSSIVCHICILGFIFGDGGRTFPVHETNNSWHMLHVQAACQSHVAVDVQLQPHKLWPAFADLLIPTQQYKRS